MLMFASFSIMYILIVKKILQLNDYHRINKRT